MSAKEANEMSFLDHLEELRWHIVRGMIAVFVFAIVAFVFRGFVFDTIILSPKSPEFWTNRMMALLGELVHVDSLKINSTPFQIININMAGQFSTHLRVSMVVGLIVGFPYIFFEFWRFLSPALHDNEKMHSRGSIFFISVLFFIGVLFGYYLITPLSVHFLGNYNVSGEVLNQINLSSYIGTVTSIALACGIVFELPVIIFFLSKVGLVTSDGLKKYRRHAFVGTLLLSAIITPPDIFSQVLVSMPLLLLYEAGIKISKRVEKKRLAES